MDKTFKKYPNLLLKPLNELNEVDINSPAKEHKALLDLGESLLIYIAGILFGEYKNTNSVNKKVEKELYRRSGRNLSMGHFQGFVRMLFKEMDDSLIHQKMEDSGSFDEAERFVLIFSVLKKVIDDGADSDFEQKLAKEMKGRSAKKAGLLEFYNTFIQLRNIYAHPKGKAGSKSDQRDWPLKEEYFIIINTPLNYALKEVLKNIHIIREYPCIRASDKIQDEEKKATFFIETDLKEKEIELSLSSDQISYLTSGQRYLLSPKQEIFSRLFYNDIPTVDKNVVKEIQKEEKAKQITPHLRQLIRDKLSDDAKIDEMEYLVLQDTARSAHISDEKLFRILNEIKNDLGIQANVGTPDEPGDIFIETKKSDKRVTFNPWWLHYFSLVSTIDNKEVKNEKDRIERLDRSIEIRKEGLKKLSSRIRSKEKQIRKQKKKIKKENKKYKDRIQDLKGNVKSATTADRKEKLKEDIVKREEINEERSQRYTAKLQKYEHELEELKSQLKEDEVVFDKEILDLKQQRDNEYFYSTWGRHKNLWEELDQYVENLLAENLNNEEVIEEDEDSFGSELWTNSSNTWQIGNLAHYYWGKIRPTSANLDDLFHIGIWIGRNFEWVPKNRITDNLSASLKNPCSVLWTSVYDDRLEKVDSDFKLRENYYEIIKNFIHSNSDKLQTLSLNVRCFELDSINNLSDVNLNREEETDIFMPVSYYLKNSNKYKPNGIYSSIWNLEEFYSGGELNLKSLNNYDNQIQTLISLFSNIIIKQNEFAMEKGINIDFIKRKEEQFIRYRDALHQIFKKDLDENKKPNQEQINEWRKYAAETYNLNEHLFDLIYNKFRWKYL